MTRYFLYALAGLSLLTYPASADVTFTGSGTNSGSGNTDTASAVFSLAGSTLTVVLADTTTAADITSKFVPTDVLTAVFFGTQKITATPDSAALTHGSSVINDNGSTFTGAQPLGGEWAYGNNVSVTEGSATLVNGISSSGLSGLFGQGNFGCTTGKNGTCDNLGGIPWGIVATPFPPPHGFNGGIASPLVTNSVTFTLTVGQGFNLSSINDVRFQYGTDKTDFSTPGVESFDGDELPEPSFFGLIGLVFGSLAFTRFWKHRKGETQAEPAANID